MLTPESPQLTLAAGTGQAARPVVGSQPVMGAGNPKIK